MRYGQRFDDKQIRFVEKNLYLCNYSTQSNPAGDLVTPIDALTLSLTSELAHHPARGRAIKTCRSGGPATRSK